MACGSMTITVPRVDARVVGGLIALFERAVGLYASLIGINAYHQPGVEAGKKAAAAVLDLQQRVEKALSGTPRTAEQIADAAGASDQIEAVYLLLEHLAANAGKVMTISDLLAKMWSIEYVTDAQYLRVWISRLRSKLGDEKPHRLIKTYTGVGYMLNPSKEDDSASTPGQSVADDEAGESMDLSSDREEPVSVGES